ncbi:tripartite ATP-independent transporter DctP family solute receptor [Azospirillum agricola]|uniref:TRAP transporter substrate-binding protein n=1 Tax=Azospirillum agricola TaxID=1720247 RepID=UPI001AE8A3B8|nr:TRAP transporter substrate-binding protein [Azospirillum agricola]MBP2230965.1 tripartite ATP-independent transporter DctP family solute receptor [Azospirillum agricola]
MTLKSILFAAVAATALLPGAAFAQTVLKLGHVWPQTEIHAKAAEMFAEDVAKATNGAVKIQVFGGSTLGSDRELVEGLKFGTVDFWVGGAGVLSAASDTAKIFTIHFMINGIDHFKTIYNGPVGTEITERIKKESGYQVVGYWLRGPRWLTTKSAVNSPADLAGRKIRVPDSPVFVKSWQALGAAPTPMNFGEVFTALQQGVIDGQENPLSLILNSKFSEVVKHLVRTEHVFEPIAVVMNSKRLEKLPEDQRKAIIDAVNARAKEFAAAEVSRGEADFLKQLQAQGMTLIEPDKAAFRAKVEPVVDRDFPSLKPIYKKVVDESVAVAR